MQLINQELLDETSRKAAETPRLRMNYNIHNRLDDPVNRMLNALDPGTYLCPHRHLTPPKTESYVVLRGELDALIFDDNGNLIQKITLNPETGNYGIDIPAGVWHSMIVKQPGTVIYEVKEGPFTPIAHEDFAPWAPKPDDEIAIKAFLNS
ncbi:MAG: WbuC family cupin fold metalloprotein [Tannerella sp.]|nr:WbuC family cupin fold metalloprotein [Tannerella sp.]